MSISVACYRGQEFNCGSVSCLLGTGIWNGNRTSCDHGLGTWSRISSGCSVENEIDGHTSHLWRRREWCLNCHQTRSSASTSAIVSVSVPPVPVIISVTLSVVISVAILEQGKHLSYLSLSLSLLVHLLVGLECLSGLEPTPPQSLLH